MKVTSISGFHNYIMHVFKQFVAEKNNLYL